MHTLADLPLHLTDDREPLIRAAGQTALINGFFTHASSISGIKVMWQDDQIPHHDTL